jgi:hypothetical protein
MEQNGALAEDWFQHDQRRFAETPRVGRSRFGEGLGADICVDRCFEFGAPILGAKLVDATKYFAQSMYCEEVQDVRGRTKKSWLAIPTQTGILSQKSAALVNAWETATMVMPSCERRLNRPMISQSAFSIKPTGYLVKEQQYGTVENFAGQARTLLLASTESSDTLIEAVEQADTAPPLTADYQAVINWQTRQLRTNECVSALACRYTSCTASR